MHLYWRKIGENMGTRKLIARLKGGLGNQLFCYAAARRLALVSGAELAIDDVSGFARDHVYRRRYGLTPFSIPCRMATPWERFQPLERPRRTIAKLLSRGRPFARRAYVEQHGDAFEPRLLDFRARGTVTLDGLWQDERYFADVADTIRSDLRIVPPTDDANLDIAAKIRNCNAVSVHVRWFASGGSTKAAAHNVPPEFYARAVAEMDRVVPDAHYFLFSDEPEAARDLVGLPPDRFTLVSHNRGDEAAYADLWLMSQCRHFIIANSTFSWWGAWLGERPGASVVLAPRVAPHPGGWDFVSLVPERWRLL